MGNITLTIPKLSFLHHLLYDWDSRLEIQVLERMQGIEPGKGLVAQQLHISSIIHIQDSSKAVFQHQSWGLEGPRNLLFSSSSCHRSRYMSIWLRDWGKHKIVKIVNHFTNLYWATSKVPLAVPKESAKPQMSLPKMRRGRFGDTANRAHAGIAIKHDTWIVFFGPYFPPRKPPVMAPITCPMLKMLARYFSCKYIYYILLV